MTHHCWKK